MCGITGFIESNSVRSGGDETLRMMNSTLTHRGPDDQGVWFDPDTGVGLGQTRLSIIDLSSQGHQPMVSHSGRYVITYNGEVYNFNALRQELDSVGSNGSGSFVEWRGHSDTEVMLAAIEHWGLVDAVKRFIGMFAFALWDRKERRLHLVRDRLGIKPLFYGWQGRCLIFASELKAIKAHPGFEGEIDRNALALLMRHNFIPAPLSIYKGIYKLPPGSILNLKLKGPDSFPQPVAYWSAKEVAEKGNANPLNGSEKEIIDQLDSILRDAVKLRMRADVPLGAFLSGGIDSSLVVGMMQAQSDRPVQTFSIGMFEKGYNEACYAKKIAEHLKTDHTELYVTPKEAMAVIPRLPTLYDEPFSDASQIPTFLVSQMARQKVTVSLSGDGGDELFGGYNRYFWGVSIWNKIKNFPGFGKKLLAKMMFSLSPQEWDQLFHRLGRLLPEKLKEPLPGDKIQKLGEVIDVNSPDLLYWKLCSHWKDPNSLVVDANEPHTALTDAKQWADLPDFPQRMMFLDTITYLPDDILTKVDRASMGVSLEARVPLLDHRVVEFAWRVPLSMKIRSGKGKWLLKQVLYKYVPVELIERPKMGFAIPIDSWLRGAMRDWAENLLEERRLIEEGFFNPEPIRKKWKEHLSGERNWQYYLWDVLMFQAWLENQKVTSG